MIAKRIIAHLKTADYEVSKNKSSQYTWSGDKEEEIDGPTVLMFSMHQQQYRIRTLRFTSFSKGEHGKLVA